MFRVLSERDGARNQVAETPGEAEKLGEVEVDHADCDGVDVSKR